MKMLSLSAYSKALGLLLAAPLAVNASWPETKVANAFKDNYPSWGALFGKREGQYDGYAWKPFTV